MKKDVCEKCGKYTYVEEHHVVPRGILPTGETKNLCPNCHTEYHQMVGRKNLKNPNYQYHWLTYLRWVSGFLVILLFFILFW